PPRNGRGPTLRPPRRMVASASDAGFDCTVATFEPRLCRGGSPFPGNGIPRARDNSPKIASRPEKVATETETPTSEPATCGPFGSLGEISRFERVRGGPGSSRIFVADQRLAQRCDNLGAFDAQRLFSLVVAPWRWWPAGTANLPNWRIFN